MKAEPDSINNGCQAASHWPLEIKYKSKDVNYPEWKFSKIININSNNKMIFNYFNTTDATGSFTVHIPTVQVKSRVFSD